VQLARIIDMFKINRPSSDDRSILVCEIARVCVLACVCVGLSDQIETVSDWLLHPLVRTIIENRHSAPWFHIHSTYNAWIMLSFTILLYIFYTYSETYSNVTHNTCIPITSVEDQLNVPRK
jgi:hypothetical protein